MPDITGKTKGVTITSKCTERQSDPETSKWLTGRLLLAVNELRIYSYLAVVLEYVFFCLCFVLQINLFRVLIKDTGTSFTEVFLVYLMFTLNRYLPIGN